MDQFAFNLRVKEIERAKTKKALGELVRTVYNEATEGSYYGYINYVDYDDFTRLLFMYRLFGLLAKKHDLDRWLQRESGYFEGLRKALSSVFTYSQYTHHTNKDTSDLCTYKNFITTFEHDKTFMCHSITPNKFRKFALLLSDNIPKQRLMLSISPNEEASSVAKTGLLPQLIEVETIKRHLDPEIRWTAVETIRENYFDNVRGSNITATQDRITVLQTSLDTIKDGKPWTLPDADALHDTES